MNETSQAQDTEKIRGNYHAPELTMLGAIASVVKASAGNGADHGVVTTPGASSAS